MKRFLAVCLMGALVFASAWAVKSDAPEVIFASEISEEGVTETEAEEASASLREIRKRELLVDEDVNVTGAEEWRNFERRMDAIAEDTKPDEN